ncbi:AraC family transcriptional regulator [Desulfobotulus sp.]|jgi:AraC family transcriptional regulator|uniref:AraC family transcriptional regulator n=1 Tax=Desulfobotulus sp. TaxID=1940337 RepID=UPI002A371AD2|nr:AraC family transcriptional regulator [Desulfobotulus sp.]MDY0163415.1 AraC family transcriptional regulator [Desulfobotulus sp.]
MENKSSLSTVPLTLMDYRRRICDAMNFISRNLDRELSLEEIAGAAAFSAFHFHRIFTTLTGESVAAFTRRLRLERAANRLLQNPRENITDIAMDCGFSSSQNFAKAFRQCFAMSPSAYRKSKAGNTSSKEGNVFHPEFSYSADRMLASSPFFQNLKKRRELTMEGSIEQMPAYHVAYVRKLGAYGPETCERAFGELMAWAGPKGYLGSERVLGVYWDNPEVTPPEKCRMDACISLPEGTEPDGGISVQKLRGGPYAVCRFEIADMDFAKAWDEAFRWFMEKGYACEDSPCLERYHNNPEEHPEGKWIVDICIPIKPA